VIQFDQGGRRFNYRVVGIAIHDGAVLLHRAGDEPFWTLPGGRAEIGETAEQTIRREMQEELSTDVEVLRLLWFVENFFDHDGLSYHEIALYFLIRFPPGSMPMARSVFEATDGGTTLGFQWVPLEGETLANLPLLPSFLAVGLRELPASVTHIVHRDTMRPHRS
jgi:ADP-ribose pyrophosphatase YjhB (NUDIX family)